MSHNIVSRIKDKSWTAGVPDKSKANYHVGMKRYEEELTWVKGKKPKFEFFNDGKYDGVRIIVE
tara:strand:+ start:46 stop:237 length:192 start_codon:yes stop_codon:yes gene_type:complete